MRCKEAEAGAYLYAVLQANIKTLREVIAMGELTLEKVLEESGLTAKWEARGETRGEARVLDLLKSGKPPEEILRLYGKAAS